MRTSLIYSFVLLVALLLQPASAQVPEVLNYQGTLADAVGRPSTGQFAMTFRLYDALSGGTLLWEEAQRNPVEVDDGSFSVVLGEVQQIGLNFDGPLFLGIEIDGTGELTPRTQLTAVAYSLHALSVAEGALQAGSNVTIVPDQGALVISAAVSGGGVTGLGGINNAATGNASTVAGGEDNTAGGDFSTIAGGRDNEASGSKSFVGGGERNTVSGPSATIVGGNQNTATATEAFIGSGNSNTATGICSFIGGGLGNTVSTFNGTIGGGWNNTVTDRFATIGGGEGNRAGSDPGNPIFVGPAPGSHATVGGGHLNTASGVSATVGGGAENLASAPGATVGGGGGNTASGANGTIPGGTDNVAGGVASFAAGTRADALHDGSFVWADRLTGIALVTLPRFASTAPNQFLIRAGGGVGIGTNSPEADLDVAGLVRAEAFAFADDFANGLSITPTGIADWEPGAGDGLRIEPKTSSPNLIGGYLGTSFIPGNVVAAGVSGATIGGGGRAALVGVIGGVNRITDNWGTVGGGNGNVAGDDDSNPNNSQDATVGGGRNNTAGRTYATVSGGDNNTASGRISTVAGGSDNTASGLSATVPGGSQNEASGNWSFAAGNTAKAEHDGAFVWADATSQEFTSTGDNQFLIRAIGGVGIGTAEPEALLHVKRSSGISGTSPGSHVAVIEHGSTSNVLALKMSRVQDVGLNNFITFFNAPGTVLGAVERNASNDGVTYKTSSADFAEYLPKLRDDEAFVPGEIVGVFGGKISHKTKGAHRLMVVTDQAAFLGNMPSEEGDSSYVPVAFVGQVKVMVCGAVKAGNYILPSGRDDGVGIAVSPEEVRDEDYARIVGRAWESLQDTGVKRVNTEVGLPLMLKRQRSEIAEQSRRIETLEEQVAELRTQQVRIMHLVRQIAGGSELNNASSPRPGLSE